MLPGFRSVTLTASVLTAISMSHPAAYADAPPPNTTAFQLEQFEPSPLLGTDILNVSTSDVMPHLRPSAGLLFHYVNSPFVVRRIDGDNDTIVEKLVEHQLKAEVAAALGLWDMFALGFILPVTLWQDGGDLALFDRPGESIGGVALQDARLFVKARILDPDDYDGFGLHVAVPMYLPIGDTDNFGGDRSFRLRPTLGLEYRRTDAFLLALNVGYNIRPERPFHDYTSDHSVPFSLGFDIDTPLDGLNIIGSIYGSVYLGESRDPEALEDGEAVPGSRGVDVPMEVIGGVRYHIDPDWSVQGGVGTGLTEDVGSPRFRAFVGVAYTPNTRDSDGDGIRDSEDDCPEIAEDKDDFQDSDGCPDLDNDADGVPDVDDGAADKSGFGTCRNDPEDKDGFQDEDGCPDPDNDNDGLPDAGDKCPNAPEDRDGFQDEDGCTDPDNDDDGVFDIDDGAKDATGFGTCRDVPEDLDGFEDEDGCPDIDNDKDGFCDPWVAEGGHGPKFADICKGTDKCPDQPETVNQHEDDDGCPDTKSKNVQLTEDAIVILQKVFFAVDKDIIKKQSFAILNEVAQVLRENPWITGVRVDGHTDPDGGAEYNLDLSNRRAASVRRYLIEVGGIEPERLTSKGFGLTKPIADNRTKAGKAANRRVEFTITSIRGVPKAEIIEQDNRPTTTE
jgi:outer membrane protein OmpA-like peptidoglycan-associated protein